MGEDLGAGSAGLFLVTPDTRQIKGVRSASSFVVRKARIGRGTNEQTSWTLGPYQDEITIAGSLSGCFLHVYIYPILEFAGPEKGP